jgi:hypothetical protein
MKAISQEDEIFNFIPVDSIGVLTGIQTNFLLNSDTLITPVNGIVETVPKIDVRRVGTYPLKPISGSTPLYQTNFLATTAIGFTQDYTGFEYVGIENPEGNLIYFGMDLTNLNADNNLDQMIDELLIGRLNFKQ